MPAGNSLAPEGEGRGGCETHWCSCHITQPPPLHRGEDVGLRIGTNSDRVLHLMLQGALHQVTDSRYGIFVFVEYLIDLFADRHIYFHFA